MYKSGISPKKVQPQKILNGNKTYSKGATLAAAAVLYAFDIKKPTPAAKKPRIKKYGNSFPLGISQPLKMNCMLVFELRSASFPSPKISPKIKLNDIKVT